MDAATLIAKALEQREAWLELEQEGGRAVKVRRPPEAEMFRFRSAHVSTEDFLRCVVGWRGFKELHIMPPGVGADADVRFDVELWLTLAQDNLVWCAKVAEAVVEAIKAHLDRSEAAAKN